MLWGAWVPAAMVKVLPLPVVHVLPALVEYSHTASASKPETSTTPLRAKLSKGEPFTESDCKPNTGPRGASTSTVMIRAEEAALVLLPASVAVAVI